ncbi:putative acetyltransferase [Sesamum alatum]|uniref:Acetyltransferase n=1 Tax=Sesamum alatum TaxID=300844 RepID=A0AAE1YET6_9LAMI|nr:putative acetyltransferase [Sesamum alatum]
MSQDQTPKVRILSTSTINAVPLHESIDRINLTPWDLELLFLEYSQKGLLLLKPSPQQEATILSKTNTTSLIHHLKGALERTLHFFSPLTGRLATTKSDDGSATCFFIDCNNSAKGALFIHATALETNLTAADILDLSTYVPEIVPSFFPLTGTRNLDGVSQPLLAVQVTELADGLFIGCSINHLLVDGTSFWHFFNSWAEISRGEDLVHDPISKLPILNRDQLTLDLVGSSDIKIYDEYLNLENIPAAHEPPAGLLRDRVFHFTKESVAKLKARANQEMVESKGQISSLQAIIAHVWRSIVRCRSAMNSGTQETTFDISIGARQRLNPPLPEEYFGNSVFPGIVTLKAWKLLENVITFVLINSPRFDVYSNDFGWGKPLAARSGRANSSDGRITIYGGFEKGSLEIEACLFAETLSALGKDAEFMEFVRSDS